MLSDPCILTQERSGHDVSCHVGSTRRDMHVMTRVYYEHAAMHEA